MKEKNLTKEEIEYLKKMREETQKPNEESKKIPLIENTYKANSKEIKQYKINIPKKFADIIQLNKEDFEVLSILNKEDNTLKFEVRKIGKEK